ncbi:MAG: DinB family protein [Ferruginibacter sp.]
MKETARIAKLLEDIYEGDPWIDVTLTGTLKNISPAGAANKIDPWNSIWEIVNHIISWRETVLQRVQGIVVDSPADNYFKPVTDQSENAWQRTLQDLKISQDKWNTFLEKMTEDDLEKINPKNNSSYYNNIHGIIQHDAYHLGQIVLLAKKSK